MRYIRMAIAEVKLARVPNQLMSPEKADKGQTEGDDENVENIDEFSGVGAIAGYSAPLGMDSDRLGRKKNSRKK